MARLSSWLRSAPLLMGSSLFYMSGVTGLAPRLLTRPETFTSPRVRHLYGAPPSVLFPRLARRSVQRLSLRACTTASGAELSPGDVVAAVEAQGKEVRRLKDEGLGNKDPQVAAAVAELLRLKALLPEE